MQRQSFSQGPISARRLSPPHGLAGEEDSAAEPAKPEPKRRMERNHRGVMNAGVSVEGFASASLASLRLMDFWKNLCGTRQSWEAARQKSQCREPRCGLAARCRF